MQHTTTLIIGAGISGLLAATELNKAGHNAIVLDKGRGVGGRMASRRMGDGLRADHGAQYFTARDERLKTYVQDWLDAGVVSQWSDGFFSSDGAPHFNGEPRYIGTTGMTAIAKHLAKSLTVHSQTKVEKICWDKDKFVVDVGNGSFSADNLIITSPVPQSLALLDAGNLILPSAIRAQLNEIAYQPIIAVLAELDAPSKLPNPGGLWPTEREPISWLADNQQKGISAKPTVTIHAATQFSTDHFDADPDTVAKKLIAAAQPYLGASVINYQYHRWRYATPTTLHPNPFLFTNAPAPILFAGDAFAGPRVEGAALSGIETGRALAKLKK